MLTPCWVTPRFRALSPGKDLSSNQVLGCVILGAQQRVLWFLVVLGAPHRAGQAGRAGWAHRALQAGRAVRAQRGRSSSEGPAPSSTFAPGMMLSTRKHL